MGHKGVTRCPLRTGLKGKSVCTFDLQVPVQGRAFVLLSVVVPWPRALTPSAMIPWSEVLYKRPEEKTPTIWKVVLTGGPCAGKTTALGALQAQFSRHGIKVFMVPEAATQIVQGGVSFAGITPEQSLAYQKSLIQLQLMQVRGTLVLDSFKERDAMVLSGERL